MFASRRSPFFWRRRSSQYSIGAIAGLAAVTAVAAAVAVYFFDPVSGQQRRALLRDQTLRASRRGRALASKVGTQLRDTAAAGGRGVEMWP
jgi:hypothetical protein